MSLFFIPTTPSFFQGLSSLDLDPSLSRSQYINKIKDSFYISRPNVNFPTADFEIIFDFLIVLRLQTWTDLFAKEKSIVLIRTLGLPKFLDSFVSLMPSSPYVNVGSQNPLHINGPLITTLTLNVENNINTNVLRNSILNCLRFINQLNKQNDLWIPNYVPKTDSFSLEYKTITSMSNTLPTNILIHTNSKTFTFSYTSLYTLMFLPIILPTSQVTLTDWNLLCNNNHTAFLPITDYNSDFNLILDWFFNGNNNIKVKSKNIVLPSTNHKPVKTKTVPDSTNVKPKLSQNDQTIVPPNTNSKSSSRDHTNTDDPKNLRDIVNQFIKHLLNDEYLPHNTRQSLLNLQTG